MSVTMSNHTTDCMGQAMVDVFKRNLEFFDLNFCRDEKGVCGFMDDLVFKLKKENALKDLFTSFLPFESSASISSSIQLNPYQSVCHVALSTEVENKNEFINAADFFEEDSRALDVFDVLMKNYQDRLMIAVAWLKDQQHCQGRRHYCISIMSVKRRTKETDEDAVTRALAGFVITDSNVRATRIGSKSWFAQEFDKDVFKALKERQELEETLKMSASDSDSVKRRSSL